MTTTQKNVGPRAVAAAAIGNALEWYDFTVYAFFASYIAHNFFRDNDPTMALISTFMVFAAGFIARPLGAVVLGAIGDSRGRKAALTWAIGAMGVGILIIVVTPPVLVIGIGAPLLLVTARLLQGFSAGGEIGGAASFLVEHAPEGQRGRYAGWLQGSMAICNILASVMGLLVTSLFAHQTVLDWAWRIPFIVGLLIIPVGIYIRASLPETDAFAEVEERRHVRDQSILTPLLRLLRHHPLGLIAAFGLSVLWTTAIYGFVIYAPTYYTSATIGLEFSATQSFTASALGNVVLLAGCLTFGHISDRLGLRPVLLTGAIILLIVPLPLLLWLHASQAFWVLITVHIVLCALVSVISAIAPVVLAAVFPPDVRASGVALSYNIAAIFFAGFTPALMAWATVHVSSLAPAYWVAFGAFVCLLASPLILKQMRHS